MHPAQLQMQRKHFERDTLALVSITLADLKKAELEDGRKEQISNPHIYTLHNHVAATNGHVMGTDCYSWFSLPVKTEQR